MDADQVREAKEAARARPATKSVWDRVTSYRHMSGNECTCELRPGMSYEDLLALNEGCTEPGDGSGWICPVLDNYRTIMLNLVRKLSPS